MSESKPILRVRIGMTRFSPYVPFHEFYRAMHHECTELLDVPITNYRAESPKRRLEGWIFERVRIPIYNMHAILGFIDAEVEGVDEQDWVTQTFKPDQLVLSIGLTRHIRRRPRKPKIQMTQAGVKKLKFSYQKAVFGSVEFGSRGVPNA